MYKWCVLTLFVPRTHRKRSSEMPSKTAVAYCRVALAVSSLTYGEVSLPWGRLNWWAGNASVIWDRRDGTDSGFNLETVIEPAWRWTPPQLQAERSGGRIATPITPWAFPACAVWSACRRRGRSA